MNGLDVATIIFIKLLLNLLYTEKIKRCSTYKFYSNHSHNNLSLSQLTQF